MKRTYGTVPSQIALLVDQVYDGGFLISDTEAHVGEWSRIQALSAAVVTLGAPGWTGAAPTSIPIPAGVTIGGRFTSIQAASGTVIAYS